MRAAILIPALAALFVVPALAQDGPRVLGVFGAWSAAVNEENGQKHCYAYTSPARSNHPRRDVLLSVADEADGRSQVALWARYRYPPGAYVGLVVGRTVHPFYTNGETAYARDGAAVITAFRSGNEAMTRGPRAGGQPGVVDDLFSLRGFADAYAAIGRECPRRQAR